MKKMKYKWFLCMMIGFATLQACTDDPSYPLAYFEVSEDSYRPEYKFYLNANQSVCIDESALPLQYRWDLNGDHVWSETEWSLSPVFTNIVEYGRWQLFIGLQVKDANGNISECYKSLHGKNYNDTPRGKYLIDSTNTQTINYFEILQTWTVTNIVAKSGSGVLNNPNFEYGSYFTWDAANKELAPGIYLPSLADWQKLIDYSGGMELAGYNFAVEVIHGVNLKYGGKFIELNNTVQEYQESGYYWTATEINEEMAYAIKITNDSDNVEIVQLPKSEMLTIRLFNNIPTSTNN